MIKDIIIHIPVGPHARLPDTDSQDLNPNKGIVFPRSLFAEVRHREELNRTGVYVLWGPGGSGQLPRAYMGEGGVLLPRLDSHAKNKDFWTHGIAFTSKDQSLNKAHVQYLEARLVQLAAEAKRCELDNTNVPQMPALSGADTADAELYLADMLLCLPVVGVSFFEKPQGPTGKSRELFLSAKGIQARGYEGPGGFVVRSGSQAVKNEVASIHTYLSDLRKALLNQNIFEDTDQRAYLNRMLRLALPFFRRRNIPRENASSNARYPGLAGYAIHAAPARSIWISRSLLTVTHFLGRTAAKSWVSPKTGGSSSTQTT